MRSSGLALIVIVVAIYSKSAECGEKMDLEGLKKFTKPLKNTCVRKTGVDLQLVDNIRLKGEFVRDQKLMCFFRCIFILMKVMNKQTYEMTYTSIQVQTDLLVKESLAARILSNTKTCIARTDPTLDSCTSAFELMKCAYNLDSEAYFIP